MKVLPIAYFPNLSYFSLLREGEVVLEGHENYQKQSWRNRCKILTANGVENLQVPVIHEGGTFKHPIQEIEVDYSRDFITRHKRAIDSAYMSSAYFPYYRDKIFSILDSKPPTLWELDCNIIKCFAGILGITMPSVTDGFIGANIEISPKKEDKIYKEKPYFQVFGNKFGGFVPNLSIMDLVFNEGPDSVNYL